MQVSVRWLQELIGSQEPVERVAQVLTRIGLPVEGMTRIGEPLQNAVVADVVAIQGDTVTLFDGRDVYECRSTRGGLKEDAKVAWCPARRRIVSEQDLGIEGSDLPVELVAESAAGSPVLDWLDDVVLIVEPAANRADLTGVLGIARELACALERQFELPGVILIDNGKSVSALFELDVQDRTDTPDYIARLVRGVRVAPSPFWLKWRLIACGVRPISNVVDVTNYILFKYGQPLHAFDFQRLAGQKIITRRARDGETIVTIDGVGRQLATEVLVIADEQRPVALAGIMGGQESEITASTRDVLIECARFNPAVIRRGARFLGLATEASRRFEMGLDPANLERASVEAAALIQTLAGGTVCAGAVQVRTPVAERELEFSWSKINQLLGLNLAAEKMSQILQRLGFAVEADAADCERARVRIPLFRPDVETVADLAEDVARIVGYDEIPLESQDRIRAPGHRHPESLRIARIREVMIGFGFCEAQTISFASEAQARMFAPVETVLLPKPLNERFAALRPALLATLLETVSLNLRRGNSDCRLFEIGKIYRAAQGGIPCELLSFAGVITGNRLPDHWSGKSPPVDFFDLSGIIGSLLSALGVRAWHLTGDCPPVFAPGSSAALFSAEPAVDGGRRPLGYLGEIARELRAVYDIPEPVLGWELDAHQLIAALPAARRYQPLPRFQSVVRDYALVTPADISVAQLVAEVRRNGGELIEDVQVFDYYAGKPLAAHQRSIGIRVTLRRPDRTLTNEEVEDFSRSLIEQLRDRFGIELRSR